MGNPIGEVMTSIYVCGTTRNSARKFAENHALLSKQLAGYDTHWFFYENDSDDGTQALLAKLAMENDNFHCRCEALNRKRWTNWVSVERAQAMCWCRNKYLLELQRLDYAFDYTLVIDMDLDVLDASILPVAMSYQADAVGANGRIDNKYYDLWALEGISYQQAHDIKVTDERVKVLSCFGGMALYKTSSLVGCWYNSMVSHTRHADHGTLYEMMRLKGRTEIYICPQWILRWKQPGT